jgi:iron complex outermembrane recepter protein
MLNRTTFLSLMGLAAATVALPAATAETTAGDDAMQLEEVVVTARKRGEALLDAPLSVNVFNEAEITSAGITRPQDFIALTPNMQMVQTQNQGTSFIVVRGISQARNSEPSVAVMIDGVLLANPSQFNQELFDIENIQVLKGPQGALYGRNAIGGAIIINTKEPGEELAGKLTVGYESGPGYAARGNIGGPVGGSDTLKFMASINYFDTDGHIRNTFLNEDADPFKDVSGRARLIWEPNDAFKADLRVSTSKVDSQALYFNITGDVNNVSLPVRVNNRGVNERDMYGTSLKMDFQTSAGTLTSITAFDHLEELLTGDQFNFLPIPQSVLFAFFGADQAQHQFLQVNARSQELRLTSPSDQPLRWILGGYGISTTRFISTGNVFDLGNGTVPAVKRAPLPLFAPQFTYLADGQDNFAYAFFGNLSYDFTSQLEGTVALRYDHDRRKNETLTPRAFIPAPLVGVAFPGQIRKRSWDDLQPQFTLRYKPSEDVSTYLSYSRGFRSGGFNQTGVGSAGIVGVGDLFDQETANTIEVGVKSQWMDRRVNGNLAVYQTNAKGTYFFVFDPNTSTQNLGNLDKVRYRGLEAELQAVVADGFDVYARLGLTDSNIRASRRAASDVGNQAPLVSKYTINLGAQYHHIINSASGLEFFIRPDFQIIGDTYFYPDNFTKRKPVNLLNLRAGFGTDRWTFTAWSKNLGNERYNAEWSPGPQFFPSPGYNNNFVFKAMPRVWGADLSYRF